MDRIRNAVIREELEIEATREFIKKRQLSWWGHLQRLNNKRQVKKVWEAKIIQKKKGRPRKSWNKVISDTLEKRGMTWTTAKTVTKNRKEWRKFVYS
ncbi:unnamed protein product [Brassicogethes aeneus]|uniref:Endonuclease-reverse transcriptase n=1 Tax=Brassicogethes aeneus TaxID=1431903 RepID=A0A9P0AZ67_BRAAE|nr:unnamed protein product [Brassicogethes aeneus]